MTFKHRDFRKSSSLKIRKIGYFAIFCLRWPRRLDMRSQAMNERRTRKKSQKVFFTEFFHDLAKTQLLVLFPSGGTIYSNFCLFAAVPKLSLCLMSVHVSCLMSHGENNFKSSIFQPIDCMCTLIILLLHKQEMKVEFQVFIFIKSEISSFIQEEFQNLLCHTNTLWQNSIFHFSVFSIFYVFLSIFP